MSYSIDTHLLLYSSDSSSSYHQKALAFLKDKLSQPEILYLAWPVAMQFLRLSTHIGLFRAPLTPEEAVRNVEHLIQLPRVRLLSEKENFLSLYKENTINMAVRGNRVPQAHLAVLLFQHGIRTLYTVDPEFLKYDFLTIRNPLEQKSIERKWWRPQDWRR